MRNMISNKIILATFALTALCCVVSALGDHPHVGGTGEEKPADDKVRDVLKNVHSQVEKKIGKSYESLTPISYRTQVVAGMNFFIKAEATEKNGAKSILHVRVYKPFGGEPHQLTAVRTSVGQHEPIEYFR